MRWPSIFGRKKHIQAAESSKSQILVGQYSELTSGEYAIRSHDDTRVISWAEYGTSDRFIVYLHGSPGGRIVTVPNLDKICMENGVRVIALDHPGVGFTSLPAKGKTILSTATDDVAHILHYRGVKKAVLVGYSAGGVDALRFLSAYPSVVTDTFLIAPVGFATHANKAGRSMQRAHYLAEHFPWMLRCIWAARPRSVPRNFINELSSMYPGEWASLSDEEKKLWKVAVDVTFTHGIRGWTGGLLEVLGKRPPDGWGFNIKQIGKINIIHGELDENIPIDSCIELADIVGDCKLLKFKRLGHMAILGVGFEEILKMINEGLD